MRLKMAERRELGPNGSPGRDDIRELMIGYSAGDGSVSEMPTGVRFDMASTIPASTISEVPETSRQPNGASVRRPALIMPTTTSDRIRIPKTPILTQAGD